MKQVAVYCIPHAGGSAMAYNKWNEFANEKIEIEPVELAGRGNRIREKLYKDLEEAAEDVYQSIRDKLADNPYVIYGHSMGSWIALEVCFKIIKEDKTRPIALIISGKEPPIKERNERLVYQLNDSEFKKEILKLGGTPKVIFEDKELKNLFVPIIRNDYKIIETYDTKEKFEKLNFPIIVFNGDEDDITQDEIMAWKNYTDQSFKFFNFSGGHFFTYENAEEVVHKINELILNGGI